MGLVTINDRHLTFIKKNWDALKWKSKNSVSKQIEDYTPVYISFPGVFIGTFTFQRYVEIYLSILGFQNEDTSFTTSNFSSIALIPSLTQKQQPLLVSFLKNKVPYESKTPNTTLYLIPSREELCCVHPNAAFGARIFSV